MTLRSGCSRLFVVLIVVGGPFLMAGNLADVQAARPSPDSPAQSQSTPVQSAPAESPPVADAVQTHPLPAHDPDACGNGATDEGPEMVVITGGVFTMGSPADEANRDGDEEPVHRVTIQPFALARCEVTVGEFRRFIMDRAAQGAPYVTTAEGADSLGCYTVAPGESEIKPRKDANWHAPGFPQTETAPVVCVTYADAHEYLVWLKQRTGEAYRLPTEAEWEYAARGGTTTSRYWGDVAEACRYANVADRTAKTNYPDVEIFDCDDRALYTQRVAQYGPNPFGLYDVLGNVWEWTADCWHENYAGAPADGRAWEAAGDCSRVIRGGSWFFNPAWVRSAFRLWFSPDDAFNDLGFRVARTLQ